VALAAVVPAVLLAAVVGVDDNGAAWLVDELPATAADGSDALLLHAASLPASAATATA